MNRESYLFYINQYIDSFPVLALLGPRQSGKTTLARDYIQSRGSENHPMIHYFDLEDPVDLARLDHPQTVLSTLKGLIVIDEIQRKPDLFPLLRVFVDRYKSTQKWLILGSASRDLIQQSSESLAGRIAYLEIMPFNLRETNNMNVQWLRGGYPDAFLANTLQKSLDWRKFYIQTFLEQDIPNLGFNIGANNLRRLWSMLAHYHANILNMAELGRSLSLSTNTIRHYLSILSSTFMIRELKPWFENISKRQVKSSKVYVRDSGLLHSLLNIHDHTSLTGHPKVGASWEGFALEEIIRFYRADPEDCYFWATHAHAELDLLLTSNAKRRGFEFKFTDAPKLTKSMKIAYETLQLDSLTVVYPGNKSYPLADSIQVIGLLECVGIEE